MKALSRTLLTIVISIILLNCSTTASTEFTDDAQHVKIDTPFLKKDTLLIVGVGDIMIGSAYPDKSNLPKDDAISSFKNVAPFLKGDIVFGNLEGCFLDSGKSTKCKDTTGNSCFAFRMPERYAGIIKDAGFNLMSIANNHVGDFGLKGRKRTTAILDSLNIKYAGLESHPSVIFEKDSVKYAFCAFAPNENTVSINKTDSAKLLVSRLKALVDIVIVSFHGGSEGAKYEHVLRKKEIFYEENRGDVYDFAHAVVDAGADIVLGHGPHVTRAVEIYKNKFIAYSLGNFCTYGMFNLKGPNGYAPLLQLKIRLNGDFILADVISVKQDKTHHLTLDTNHTAFKKIRFLTNTDFPGNRINFFANGRIEPKKD